MNRMLRSPLVSRAVSSLCLLLLVFSQIIPLRAETWPTQWSFECLENSSSEWWQSLRVQTVPGVLYHLQQSETLADGSWTTVETTYGSGEEWICPLMQGAAPVTPPPVNQPVIPAVPANPIRLAYLIMERTDTGGTLVSWCSLDDHTAKRMVLPGVTLDPVWEEFESSYMNQHGNHYFALSPNLHRPVSFSGAGITLGTLDSAMIADFTASLPAITANITNSVANAALYSHQPAPAGARKFYRIAADWSLDSDGDGRLDWQELVLDGNNPFSADSDGDGINDVAAGTGSGSGSTTGYPAPTDAEDPTPLASIEQQTIVVARAYSSNVERNGGISVFPQYAVTGLADTGQFESCASYASLKNVVDSFTPPESNGWSSALDPFTCENDNQPLGEGGVATRFQCGIARFRLRLDRPAPAGGYHIPLRVGVVNQNVEYDDGTPVSSVSSNGTQQDNFVELTLECAEGQTLGTIVELQGPETLAQNRRVTYIPANITTRTPDQPSSDPHMPSIPGAVFEEGACVTGEESIVLDFGNSNPGLIPDFYGNLQVFWQRRKLLGSGTMEDWQTIFRPDPNNPLQSLAIEGTHCSASQQYPGIYQLKAVLVLPDATQIDFPFVRMRNTKSMENGEGDANPLLAAGQPDYYGICPNPLSKAVRDEARKWLGSTAYAVGREVPIDPGYLFNVSTAGDPKCNIFVTHMANQVGATTPFFYRKKWGITVPFVSAPIAKVDWHKNPEDNIDLDPSGWHYLDNSAYPPTNSTVEDFSHDYQGLSNWRGGPCPGMVCSSPRTSAGPRHGHVGIMDYDGSWINAGSKTVNKSLHLLDTLDHYKPNTFRSR